MRVTSVRVQLPCPICSGRKDEKFDFDLFEPGRRRWLEGRIRYNHDLELRFSGVPFCNQMVYVRIQSRKTTKERSHIIHLAFQDAEEASKVGKLKIGDRVRYEACVHWAFPKKRDYKTVIDGEGSLAVRQPKNQKEEGKQMAFDVSEIVKIG